MATIRTSIQIMDGMTPAFRSMTTAMNIVLNSFESLQRASHNAIDTNSIQTARSELARAEVSFNQVEQGIRDANEQQQGLNQSINQGQRAASGFGNIIRNIAVAVGGFQAVKTFIGASDEYSGIQAKLRLINDGQQTVQQLNDKIFQSAQNARGSYTVMADVIGKLGITAKDAFSGNDEIVRFTNLLSKSFKIAGASATEQSSAIYQLTQAMASGRLQGDEFRTIRENAPMLAQSIAEEMDVSMGSLKELGAEGKITSQIIKNALFGAATEINSQFATIPKTFGDVVNQMKNSLDKRLQPAFQEMSTWLGSVEGAKAIDNIAMAVSALAITIGTVAAAALTIGSFIQDNWSLIAPIVWGVIAALTVYYGAMGIAWLATIRTTIASWLETAAIIAMTFAQQGLNTALALCPISWILIGIIAIISVFYLVIAAINKFANTSYSATGMIAGAFMTMAAFIGNVIIAAINIIIDSFAILYNFIASFVEFFANVFDNPVASIIRLFASMADSVMGILEGIASAIDTLFNSNLAGAVSGWRSSLEGMVTDLVGEAKIKVERIDPSSLHLDRFNYGEAYKTGDNFGRSVAEKFDISKIFDNKDLGDYGDQAKIASDAADTAANTGAMKDTMEASEEDLKYLRDLAEQEIVNRFTTAAVKVETTNHNNINSNMDLDGVVSYFGKTLEETIETVAEGVHK